MKKKDVKKYIKLIESYLTEKYGEIKGEWKLILSLLEDNISLYFECKEELKNIGMFDKATYKKNPLLATLKDLQATILKQIQHLGLSPYAANKITDIAEDDSEDFINNLTT
ncbi:MAG: P27 family phage terminase small subunit [Muribaculaceae bacterium]|nr:P27 family phage terminase small subunit [Muribaculaceae bacterium]